MREPLFLPCQDSCGSQPTVVCADRVLFAVFGSVTVAVLDARRSAVSGSWLVAATFTVSVTEPISFGVTVIVTLVEFPAVMLPSEHVTVPDEDPHAEPGFADTNVVVAGIAVV